MAKILFCALATVGGAVSVLSALGAFGVGDFEMHYGPSAVAWCKVKGGE
ncbi:hypothetical protein [Chromobacterium violaceum]|nr:hypothetical protein [Chromobacterium violaceum]MBX9267261.1 hypothetical protein [Chromobacterium violaceum]